MATQVTPTQLVSVAAAAIGILGGLSTCADRAIEGSLNAVRIEMRARDQACDERLDLLERPPARKAVE